MPSGRNGEKSTHTNLRKRAIIRKISDRRAALWRAWASFRIKLEIKFLLLYIASRLIEPVPFEAMQELAMIDDGVDFFDFSECMNDPRTSGHLTLSEDGLYAITEKGLRNGQICESAFPTPCASRRTRIYHRVQSEAASPRTDPIRDQPPRPNGTYTVSLPSATSRTAALSEDGADGTYEVMAKDLADRFREEHRAAF